MKQNVNVDNTAISALFKDAVSQMLGTLTAKTTAPYQYVLWTHVM